jgi:hypothetical protein
VQAAHATSVVHHLASLGKKQSHWYIRITEVSWICK